MDAITRELIEMLKRQAVDIGAELMDEGLGLLRQHLEGRASDQAIMSWLRTAQEES